MTAVDIHAPPPELTAERQWAVRRAKVPYIAGIDRKAKSTDPTTWRSFDAAAAAVQAGKGDGLYYALRRGSGIVGIDLDHCVTDGVIEPWAMVYVRLLNSYTCLSASGTGLRILLRAEKRSERCKKGPVECYDHDRFLSITDQHLAGTPTTIEERQAELEAFEQLAFPEERRVEPAPAAAPPAAVDLSGDRRFAAAMRDPLFARLHAGDIAGYASQSEARLAYLNRAAFYSARGEALMDGWFRASALDHSKWDRLRAREIGMAIDGCRDTYDPSYRSERPHTWPELTTAAPEPTNGNGHEDAGAGDQVCIPTERYQELVAAEQRLESISAVLARSGLQPAARIVAIGAILELESRQDWKRPSQLEQATETPDGYRIVSRSRLKKRTGMSEATVGRHIKAVVGAGVLRQKVVGQQLIKMDPQTGRPIRETRRYMALQLVGSADEALGKTAAVKPPNEWGGERKRKRDACPEHPLAATYDRTRRETVCEVKGCGRVLQSVQVGPTRDPSTGVVVGQAQVEPTEMLTLRAERARRHLAMLREDRRVDGANAASIRAHLVQLAELQQWEREQMTGGSG